MNKMKRIDLYVWNDMLEWLKKQAKKERISFSLLIRRIILKEMEKQK